MKNRGMVLGIFLSCVLFCSVSYAKTTIFNRSYSRSSYLSNNRTLNSKTLSQLFSKQNTFTISAKPKEWTYFIAPHPDDEILCCAETISKKLQQDTPVKIIYITNGDGLSKENTYASIAYGRERKKESLNALKRIGLSEKDTFFLNFPDGELHRLNTKNSIISSFTGRRMSENISAFPFSPYTYQGLQKNLEDLFLKYPPKEVFLPSQKDTHPDHKFSGKIVQNTLKKLEKKPKIFGYTIHGNKSSIKSKINSWKKSLITLFESQFHDEFHRKYLLNFAQKKEAFTRIQK